MRKGLPRQETITDPEGKCEWIYTCLKCIQEEMSKEQGRNVTPEARRARGCSKKGRAKGALRRRSVAWHDRAKQYMECCMAWPGLACPWLQGGYPISKTAMPSSFVVAQRVYSLVGLFGDAGVLVRGISLRTPGLAREEAEAAFREENRRYRDRTIKYKEAMAESKETHPALCNKARREFTLTTIVEVLAPFANTSPGNWQL